MKITVKLFAGARELASQEQIEVELRSTPTIGELRTALATACPALEPLLPHTLFAINANYATDEAPVPPEAEVACIPPVSGG